MKRTHDEYFLPCQADVTCVNRAVLHDPRTEGDPLWNTVGFRQPVDAAAQDQWSEGWVPWVEKK